MYYFSSDNTEGYFQHDIDELNKRLHRELRKNDIDPEDIDPMGMHDYDQLQAIGERVIRDHDTYLAQEENHHDGERYEKSQR